MHSHKVAEEIAARSKGAKRYIAAIAGAPGAGKSTLAGKVADRLNKKGIITEILALDGFHFDNAILESRGHLARKGAPHTFDVAGFTHTLQRVKSRNEDVCVPVFDRALELSRASARMIDKGCRIVLVEGNYLLLDQLPWSKLKTLFDFTIFLKVDDDELEKRSIDRWLHYGFSQEEGQKRAQLNDLPNARYVIENSATADMVLINQQESTNQ